MRRGAVVFRKRSEILRQVAVRLGGRQQRRTVQGLLHERNRLADVASARRQHVSGAVTRWDYHRRDGVERVKAADRQVEHVPVF